MNQLVTEMQYTTTCPVTIVMCFLVVLYPSPLPSQLTTSLFPYSVDMETVLKYQVQQVLDDDHKGRIIT